MNKEQSSTQQSIAIKTFVYPIFAGACIFLGFERYNLFPVLFLLPFFLNGMRELSLKRKLLAYWIMAISANVGGYHWIRIVSTEFGGLPAPLGWGLVLFFAMFNNLNFVLWGYLERFFGEKSNPFIIAALFVVAEQINPQVFPWYFGTGLDSALIFYQTGDLLGVSGLSFVAMALIHIPYWLWQHRSALLSNYRRAFVGQMAFLIFITGYGTWGLHKYNNNPGPDKKSVTVSVIQSNTSMEKFYGAELSRDERLAEFQGLINVSRKAIAANPEKTDLVIWPEGSVHFPILHYRMVHDEIANLARSEGVYVVAGSVEYEMGSGSNGRYTIYNTMFVFNPAGQIVGKYHKIQLLAFGEYIPFLDTFPFLEKWLPSTISHFTRGTEKPIFELNENVHWLPLICYEDIISGFISGFDHRRADFLVNITNDGWFGKSDASYLHKQMARPRTVEYRKPIIRALNTGSSQIIDAAGRTISKETPLYQQDFIDLTLHLPQKPPVTLYSLWGNWPIYVLILAVALLWVRKTYFLKPE